MLSRRERFRHDNRSQNATYSSNGALVTVWIKRILCWLEGSYFAHAGAEGRSSLDGRDWAERLSFVAKNHWRTEARSTDFLIMDRGLWYEEGGVLVLVVHEPLPWPSLAVDATEKATRNRVTSTLRGYACKASMLSSSAIVQRINVPWLRPWKRSLLYVEEMASLVWLRKIYFPIKTFDSSI